MMTIVPEKMPKLGFGLMRLPEKEGEIDLERPTVSDAVSVKVSARSICPSFRCSKKRRKNWKHKEVRRENEK